MAHSCSGGAQPPSLRGWAGWHPELKLPVEAKAAGHRLQGDEPERAVVGRLTGSSGTELGPGWYSRLSESQTVSKVLVEFSRVELG